MSSPQLGSALFSATVGMQEKVKKAFSNRLFFSAVTVFLFFCSKVLPSIFPLLPGSFSFSVFFYHCCTLAQVSFSLLSSKFSLSSDWPGALSPSLISTLPVSKGCGLAFLPPSPLIKEALLFSLFMCLTMNAKCPSARFVCLVGALTRLLLS